MSTTTLPELTTNPATPSADLITRACACCESVKADPVVRSRPPAEEAPFPGIRDCWTGFFKEKLFFTYSRCRDCGLLYNQSYLSPEQTAELYGDMPENMSGVPAASLARTQRGYYDFFRRFSAPAGDYLEVGPDTGLFTQYVARESTFVTHHLFEPNRAAHADLTQRMGDRPHRVHQCFMDFDAVADGSVAAVTMIHVLDHLLEPLDTLRRLRRTLVPGGLVMVVVHDESSLLARLLGPRWPAFCLQHPQLYQPATIRALFEQAGFRVLATERTVNHFPAAYLVQHLAYALKLGRLPALLPAAWSVPLKLGNFVTAATA